jgi:hypothetical protein
MVPWEDLEEEEEQKRGEKGEYCEMCGKKGFWIHLGKCPMCHRYFCDACRYTYGGKEFCTRHCANEFFWGGEDGDIDE